MRSKRRRLNLESLESRTVLNAGPIGILDISPDHTFWNLQSPNEASTIPIHDAGPSSSWSPKLYGDFTGDDVADVLGTHQNGDWWLQVNDGTQLFTLPWGSGLDAAAEHLGTADFNKDGLLDVLSLNRATGELWVSVNSRNNGFRNQTWGTLPSTASENLTIGDFDGDGDDDVLSSSDETWWLAQNTGSAFELQAWGRFPFFDWQNVVSGNFNNDNIADVAARAGDSTWWVWFGGNDGFESAQYWGHWKMRDAWHDVSVADFNDDGRDDLIARTEDDGRLWVGSTTDTRFHTWTWSKGWVHRADWSEIQHRDMNGDGLIDQLGKSNADGWYYAQNVDGQSFDNYFWQRAAVGEFTVIVDDFHAEQAHDILPAFPAGGIDASQSEVFVGLSEDNKLVITGSGINIAGLELLSASGSLIPIPGEPAPADPFEFLLSNSPTAVTLGNILEEYRLEGSVTLNVGWDVASGSRDLEVNYGVGSNVLPALVTEPIGVAPAQAEYTTADVNKIYYDSLDSSLVAFPDA